MNHTQFCPKHTLYQIKNSYIFIGLASLCWLIFKTGSKPSRIQYPCQQAAAANVSVFLLPLLFIYFQIFQHFFSTAKKRNALLLLTAVTVGTWLIWQGTQYLKSNQQELRAEQRVQAGALGIPLGTYSAAGKPLFAVIPHAEKLPSPHRVVSIHDSNATSWDFSCMSSGVCANYYGDNRYVNQQVINKMVATGVMRLTSTNSAPAAWKVLLPDYQQGEKIAIKENFNDSIMGGGISGYGDNDAYVDALPQILNAVIAGLKSIGVVEDDIWVFDASRYITDRFRDGVYYSGIHYFDRSGNGQDVKEAGFSSSPPDDALINFSDSSYGESHQITDVLVQATYLINIPILKRHGGAGITLCLKNHLGTINGFTSGSHSMHNYFYLSGSSYESDKNPIVEINNNPHIKNKTILNIGDGLYGTYPSNNSWPKQWSSFTDDSPNLLFFSVDPVAVDSVMTDFIKRNGVSFPDSSYDILQVAAQTGMGVYESWNNDDNRKYEVIDFHEIDFDLGSVVDKDTDNDTDGLDLVSIIKSTPDVAQLRGFAALFGVDRTTDWHPAPGTSWQWQLSGDIDTSFDVQMYDVDLVDTTQNTINQLHADGRRVVCYFSAGSWENWRPDKDSFPESVKGNDLSGWPDEKWLDIRQLDILKPIMEARLNLAVNKKCDGVEPDNVDGYTNSSGFTLSGEDQKTYNRWLAGAAHARGLSVGLKNDLDQIPDLVPYFDWALNEQCFQYNECDKLLPFINNDKAVFGVEYTLETSAFCTQANGMNFDWLKKTQNLDSYRVPCR